MTVDLSYRESGVCLADFSNGSMRIFDAVSIKNPEIGRTFDDYVVMANRVDITVFKLNQWIKLFNPDVIIIEVPCFTQSAKSAIAIGVCWGMVSNFYERAIPVQPSALKKWSGSIKGDGKEEVKNKVISRVHLDKKIQSNDNIVDAIGLALMFDDLISQIKYETTKKQNDFETFVLSNEGDDICS